MILLAVALPMQGVAATTMISCGAGQHNHATGQSPAHSHAGAVDHHSAGKSAIAKASVHKCSACASCCMSAAMPSQAIVFTSVEATDHFAPLAARSVTAPVVEGLERPPRAAPA